MTNIKSPIKSFFYYSPVTFLFIGLLILNGCGQATKQQSNSSVETNIPVGFQELNASFASIKDESTALKAVNDLEDYVNRKTNQKISVANVSSGFKTLSFNTDKKHALAAKELEMRHPQTPLPNTLKAANADSVDDENLISYEAYTQQQIEDAEKGLSSQALADILNATSKDSIKTSALKALSDTPKEFTATDIEIIRDKTLENMPAAGDTGSDRITPLEAILLGYFTASDDDGNKNDGEVNIYATQAQINDFINKIIE